MPLKKNKRSTGRHASRCSDRQYMLQKQLMERDRMWYYILTQYIQKLNSQRITTNDKVNEKGEPVTAGSVPSSSKTKAPPKPDGFDTVLKHITISSDTSSTSTDLSPEASTQKANLFPMELLTAMMSGRPSVSNDANISSPETSEKTIKTGSKQALKQKEEESESSSEFEEVSRESLTAKREPSWNTVMQMMEKFSFMKEMFANGQRDLSKFR